MAAPFAVRIVQCPVAAQREGEHDERMDGRNRMDGRRDVDWTMIGAMPVVLLVVVISRGRRPGWI